MVFSTLFNNHQAIYFTHTKFYTMKNHLDKPVHQHPNHKHSELIQMLNDCVAACEACSVACLEEPDLMSRCIELDRDCADICALGARLLQRNSEISHIYLAICEEACRECADECVKHDSDHCKACADVCERCAEACHAHHGNVTLK